MIRRGVGAAWAWMVVLVCVAGVLSGCRGTDDTWVRIQETGVLRVGLDPTYPPFENADGVELQGIDVDLARAIGDTLEVEVQFAYFGYDGLYDALLTEQVDVLLSALVVQPELSRDFAFSEPYFNAGQILIVPGASALTGMEKLGGRTVAVELGAAGHVEATRWQRRVADLTVVPYDTSQAALEAVAAGAADAVLIDSISGRQFLRDTPALRRLSEPVTVEPYAAVVRDGDGRLLQEINGALETLDKNGTLDAIQREWLEGTGG